MPLRDRPEFQAWLERFEARHVALHGGHVALHGDEPRAADCDGCGDPIDTPISAVGLCMVCLAETYGHERGLAAGRIAGMMEAALARAADVRATDVREAVEEVLERYERGSRGEANG